VGKFPIRVSYYSPDVRDQKIWGELHPFGQNWIAGANERTTITIEEDVRINVNDLAAGFYVFLNGEDDWQLVFNKNSMGNSGAYNRAQDVLHIAVRHKMSHTTNASIQCREPHRGAGVSATLYFH